MSYMNRDRRFIAIILMFILAYSCTAMAACGGLGKKSSGYTWEKVLENQGLSLVDISILDESNIWAIDWVDEVNGLFSKAPFFNGKGWDKQYSFEGSMLTDIYICDVPNIWAVGSYKLEEGLYPGRIFSYDGQCWQMRFETQDKSGLISVIVLDENHVWAAGKGIYFFNGSEWSKQFESAERLQSIYALDADDAWAVSESGMIYHFDGSSWSEQQRLHFPNERFFISHARMHALDESHAWAALYDTESEITRIFFFDGSSWEEQLELPRTMVVTGIHALDEKHVWASCGNAFGKQCPILFFDGREWSIQEECDESLIGIKALSEDEILAVGESGSIYKGRKD